MKPEVKPEELAYWQGTMDGLASAKMEINDAVEAVRKNLAKSRHVHYTSILGPYCVICRTDMKVSEYQPYWSKE